jgi:transglycosylase-like protein
MLMGRLLRGGRHDEVNGAALFPQGGSTITQQLVRGVFLRPVTAQEKSHQLRPGGLAAGLLSPVLGARSVNMLARKREEVRLSLWLEQEMRERFGSKRRAKEEILARYASFVYMGNGQYGFARAAEYYFVGGSRPSPPMMPTKPGCSPASPNHLAITRQATRTRIESSAGGTRR